MLVEGEGGCSLEAQRRALPIFPARGALLREIRECESCIVVGETGSGKTTQIPQYLLEGGFTRKGGIACTQPRRVAAVSIAKRVSLERGAQLGREVGYSVRFDDCSCRGTKLKYMTDGMLLREAITDPLLLRYSVVILDEAHERTVHTDILFGVVKAAQRGRSEGGRKKLRVVVMSATLAAEEFSQFFNRARVLYIQGRQFPVQVYYTASPQPDYLHAAITTVLQLHEEEEEEEGDILLFLSGREEIESAQSLLNQCRALLPQGQKDLLVVPLFAALPSKQQQLVFLQTPQGCRKVILSTNIAETSITIPGVRSVIDSGVVKARGYNPHIGLDLLTLQPTSKAQARQRAGRAGREGPGACYRLYTEQTFQELAEDTVPEIQRCPLASVVLQLLAMGVSDLLSFEFMAPPSEEALVGALEQLYLLGVVERKGEGEGEGEGVGLTPLGRRMAQFPLEPCLARAILMSQEHGCSEDVVSVVALLSVDSILYTPPDQREKAMAAREKFLSSEGDHLTLLNIYRGYRAARGNKAWCRENFIHMRHMRSVMDVRRQLVELCGRVGVPLGEGERGERGRGEGVRRSLLQGLFTNVAEHAGEGRYLTVGTRQEVYLHPSSSLHSSRPHPHTVMFSQLIHTSRCYLRDVSVIESDWLMETAPLYFKKNYSP